MIAYTHDDLFKIHISFPYIIIKFDMFLKSEEMCWPLNTVNNVLCLVFLTLSTGLVSAGLPSILLIVIKWPIHFSLLMQANKYERNKSSTTYKDLDFMEHHTEGILLEADTYKALMNTLERDCRVSTRLFIVSLVSCFVSYCWALLCVYLIYFSISCWA